MLYSKVACAHVYLYIFNIFRDCRLPSEVKDIRNYCSCTTVVVDFVTFFKGATDIIFTGWVDMGMGLP